MRWSLTIAALLCVSIPVPAEDITIHGFVTDVKSPTRFVIDDYKVTRDSTLLLEVNGPQGLRPLTFRPEDIRVGTELEVKGKYYERSRQLKARSIKVFLEDAGIVKRTALLEQIPILKREGSGWEGEIRADGERIRVRATTSITIKPNKSESRKLSAAASHESSELMSVDGLNLDTFVRYEGPRNVDGKIDAAKIEFEHAELEPGEARLWKRLEPEVKPPDYSDLVPGEFKTRGCIYRWCTQQIVPSKDAQDYIEKIGQSLIPPHQKELAAGDPLRIPFRFYLVKAKTFNAVAYPNGVVLVHSGVFDILQNEAQLAFVLAHEISHAVEKHAWLAMEYHRQVWIAQKTRGAFAPFGGSPVAEKAASGIPDEYLRSLENQADRVALRWMLAAGYDLREAPASWKAVSMKKEDEPVNLLWNSHDSKTTRRSYLMAELRNSYFDVDFSKLKKDSKEFHHVAEVVKQFEVQGKQTKTE